MRRNVVAIENYHGTELGHVGIALAEAGVRPTEIRMHAGGQLPESTDQIDALVILGGAQSALDDGGHPYYPALLDLIRDMAASDRPVLGICLGAQLIARALGGENHLNSYLEFGYHDVRPTEIGRSDPLFSHIDPAAISFQWHQDSASLPPGADLLMTNDATTVQAFRYGRNVYATQFHFEAPVEMAKGWTERAETWLAEHLPNWRDIPESDFAAHGPGADAFGLDLARRWVKEMIWR